MKTSYFGDVAPADGELAVMDGGMHGVQGHALVVARDNRSARWERRIDSFRPSGTPGAGITALTEVEQADLARWREVVGGVAESRFFPPPASGPPRWVWAIALGDRLIEGGAIAPGSDAPAGLAPLLAWLRTRVDGLA